MRAFCERSGLVGTVPADGRAEAALEILDAQGDFGGIFVCEDYLGTPEATFELVAELRRRRPELPVFLRRERVSGLAGLEPATAAMFTRTYSPGDLCDLQAGLEASIFRRLYPNELARGIREMSKAALEALFDHCEVVADATYVASDLTLPDELFTLIGIDGAWCKGYMTLFGPEQPLLDLLAHGRDAHERQRLDFRELNQYVAEATNLIWGSFRSRYIDENDLPSSAQVPIVVNHQRRFISFGSDEPQLCFRYVLRSRAGEGGPHAWLHQRFVFNLAWKPEAFRSPLGAAPEVPLVEEGELDLF